jgi:hypothetical protein
MSRFELTKFRDEFTERRDAIERLLVREITWEEVADSKMKVLLLKKFLTRYTALRRILKTPSLAHCIAPCAVCSVGYCCDYLRALALTLPGNVPTS